METGNWPREERERDIETGRSVNSSRGQAEGNGGIWFAESLLVVAILMATVAFQARLSPPGGVWQDTASVSPSASPSASPPASPPGQTNHTAGQSVLWVQHVVRYRLFAISNDITLALSLLAIQLLLARNFVKPLPPQHVSDPVSSKQSSSDRTKQGIVFRTDYLQTAAVISTAVALVSLAFTYVASAVSISSDGVQTISLSVVLVFSVTLSVTLYVFKVKTVRNFCTGTSN